MNLLYFLMNCLRQETIAIALILTFWFSSVAWSQQTGRGTLIIVGYSQKKIVVAADSRKSSYSGNQISDDDCKLIPFDGFSIFATVGNVGYRTEHTMGWDGNREAIKIITSSKKTKSIGKYLRNAANEWGQNIAAEVNRSLVIDRDQTMWAVQDNRILNGMFVGFEKQERDVDLYSERERNQPQVVCGGRQWPDPGPPGNQGRRCAER